MPMHDHECEQCGRKETVYHSIHESPEWPTCCGDVMPRFYGKSDRNVTGVFHKPIKMHSIGMAHQDEIDAFRQRNPEIEIHDDPDHPDFGVPIITTREEKLRVLRNEGYEEKK